MIQSDPHGDMRRLRQSAAHLPTERSASNILLKVPYASLNKNRPYAGTSEHPRVPVAVTISRRGQSAGKADLGRGRNPQRLYADHRAPAVKIKSDPHGDVRRSREIVARLNPS